VPEENFWTSWCKGRLTEADTPTIRLGATPSRLTSVHFHHPLIFFTCQMPFLPPKQQCQPVNATSTLKHRRHQNFNTGRNVSRKPQRTWIRHSSVSDHFIEKNTKWPYIWLCTETPLICSFRGRPLDRKLCVYKWLQLFLDAIHKPQANRSYSYEAAQDNSDYKLIMIKLQKYFTFSFLVFQMVSDYGLWMGTQSNI